MSEEQERLREREELIHALRNFAEHFGAAEVYEQAKVIYLESPAGRAAREHEAAASFDSVLRDSSRPVSDRQKSGASGRRAGRGSPALEDAKKLLGG
jgi:hypothetical protein